MAANPRTLRLSASREQLRTAAAQRDQQPALPPPVDGADPLTSICAVAFALLIPVAALGLLVTTILLLGESRVRHPSSDHEHQS